MVPSVASPVDVAAVLDVEEAEELFDVESFVLDELLFEVDLVEVVVQELDSPNTKGQRSSASSQDRRNAIAEHTQAVCIRMVISPPKNPMANIRLETEDHPAISGVFLR